MTNRVYSGGNVKIDDGPVGTTGWTVPVRRQSVRGTDVDMFRMESDAECS